MAIFQIQSKLVEGMLEYLRANDYLQVFTPCLLGGTSEGGAEVFEVDYFGKEAFLRQDPQLHRQLCIAAGFDKIYDLGPNWRAELSHTPRHLCEHRGLAVEFGFMQDETDMMRVEEETILAALKKVKSECARELELLQVDPEIPNTPFPEMRFPEIYDILDQYGKKVPIWKRPRQGRRNNPIKIRTREVQERRILHQSISLQSQTILRDACR